MQAFILLKCQKSNKIIAGFLTLFIVCEFVLKHCGFFAKTEDTIPYMAPPLKKVCENL